MTSVVKYSEMACDSMPILSEVPAKFIVGAIAIGAGLAAIKSFGDALYCVANYSSANNVKNQKKMEEVIKKMNARESEYLKNLGKALLMMAICSAVSYGCINVMKTC